MTALILVRNVISFLAPGSSGLAEVAFGLDFLYAAQPGYDTGG